MFGRVRRQSGGCAEFQVAGRESTADGAQGHAGGAASAADCAAIQVKQDEHRARAKRGQARRHQTGAARGEPRIDERHAGMPRPRAARRAGSATARSPGTHAASGRQWSRKRAAQPRHVQCGTNWCRITVHAGGSHRLPAARSAAWRWCSVPVVKKHGEIRREVRPGSGNAESVSPTLAACSQSRRPGGRGRLAWPERSGRRFGDFLAAGRRGAASMRRSSGAAVGGGECPGSTGRSRQRRFFFAKKKQKTFICLRPDEAGQLGKSFLRSFFKKEHLRA